MSLTGRLIRALGTFAVNAILLNGSLAHASVPCETQVHILIRGSSPTVRYAAEELRDYAKKVFGQAWPIETRDLPRRSGASWIVLSSDQKPAVRPSLQQTDGFGWLPTRSGLEIRGRNDRSVLYGVYELVRTWGVRFYLSQDVLPSDSRCTLPSEETHRNATLKMRGVHPYPDFLAGPSSWDYPQFEKYIRQLPKLGLNFFGIHQYTYEPYVDYEVDGQYPQTGTLETTSTPRWGYGNQSVCEFEVGRELFPAACEWGSQTALESTQLSARERYRAAQSLMGRALKLAHDVGLVTAFGFEPLSHDPEFATLANGAEGLERVTQARIDGTLRAFPNLDYLWLFTDESDQADPARLLSTYRLISSAEKYLKRQDEEKSLMIGGWNIEATLRKFDVTADGVSFGQDTVFTSYGNYDPWRTVQENRYALFKGMDHAHSIATWCEYDGRLLAGIQPNVTAYEKMSKLMRDSGSLGFFLLHWNTRLCDSNLAYLSQEAWRTEIQPARAFYLDYYQDRLQASGHAWVDAILKLEQINRSFAFGSMAFWLMADDWTPQGPWKRLADSVSRFRRGKPLSAEDRRFYEAQLAQARNLSRQLKELDEAVTAFDRLSASCRSNCEHATFLANRVRYFASYLSAYVKLSLGLEHFLESDLAYQKGARAKAHEEFQKFAASLDMKSWLDTLQLYTRLIDDRGERGIVVSLNQKILSGLRALEKNLAP